MLKLLTDCDKCMYKRVCKYYDHPRQVMEKLKILHMVMARTMITDGIL